MIPTPEQELETLLALAAIEKMDPDNKQHRKDLEEEKQRGGTTTQQLVRASANW